jgi:hypothetical protein
MIIIKIEKISLSTVIINNMQSVADYVNINYNGSVIKCKEVIIPGVSYSKLVTSDGNVAIAYSPGTGEGWSTNGYKPAIKQQMIFDSRITLYVLSQEFKDYYEDGEVRFINDKQKSNEYKKFIEAIIPDIGYNAPYLSAFMQLKVKFIPENTMFRINEYDGSESVD